MSRPVFLLFFTLVALGTLGRAPGAATLRLADLDTVPAASIDITSD